jgi:hypothetical protein
MAFTQNDFHNLVRLLTEHPEWRAELRRLVLTEELLDLPAIVRDLAQAVRELAEAQRQAEERLRRLEERQAALEGRVDRVEAALIALAEAQRRTEERVSRLEEAVTALAEAQRRTEERVSRLEEAVTALAEAQRRTEERVSRLEEAVTALAEAQRRTEERVEALAEVQRHMEERLRRVEDSLGRLSRQVGTLANTIGAQVEDDAESALYEVLPAKGYQIIGEPRPVAIDGEVDVAVPVRDSEGRMLWVLVEAKVRLRRGDVHGWARRLQSPDFRELLAAREIVGPLLPYAFGIRVYGDAVQAGHELGLGIISLRGEQVQPAGLV